MVMVFYLGDVARLLVLMDLMTCSHQIRTRKRLLHECGRQLALYFLKIMTDLFGFGNLSIHCQLPASNGKLKFIAEAVSGFLAVLYCQLSLTHHAILLPLQTLLHTSSVLHT
jgi:hypothetical protein